MKGMKKLNVEKVMLFKSFVQPPRSHSYCHAPTVCEAPSGRLLLAFYAGQREGAPDSAIFGAVSFDKGKTWSIPKVWVQVPKRAVANPRLFVGPDENVWLLFGVNYGPRWCSGDTYLFVKRSPDEAETWYDMELFHGQKGLLGKNKPFHENDLWVFPLEWEHSWSAAFLRSEDNGQTMELTGDLGRSINAHLIQPALVKLRDGRLRAYMRSQEGWIFTSDSWDNGKSWTLPQASEIPNNNSGIDVLRTRSGLLLLACNPVGLLETPKPVEAGWPEELPVGFMHWGPRSPLVLLVSDNDGENWSLEIILEQGEGEYSYPSLIQGEKGIIHVVYTYRRMFIAHVAISETVILSLI